MRFNIRTTLVAMALILGLSGAAQAATLWAGPLFSSAETSLLCSASNVGDKMLVVTIEVLDFEGTVLGRDEVTLQPGESQGRGFPNDGEALCRFTVPGSRANVRATAAIFEAGRGSIAAVPAR